MTSGTPQNPAEVYDQYFGPSMFVSSAKPLMAHASLSPGQKVLDLACGSGVVTEIVAGVVGSGGSVVGLDFSPPMLGVARAKSIAGASVEWVEADASKIPFPDDTFDAVVCQHGFQFFPDPLACVNEVKRVLKPGGRLTLTVWADAGEHPLYEAVFRSVSNRIEVPYEMVARPFLFGSLSDVSSLLKGAGFGEVKESSESFDVSFPSPDRWAQLSVMGAAAAVPAFGDLSPEERGALGPAVAAEVKDLLKSHIQGDSVVVPMKSHYATGTI
ncbi:MAG: methyltransferase domain-containing protein [Chloroflexi bacterium]|nr:methyltransferase domain-containing protein [Chloroflexota bacterium]MBT4073526.1 methyltransferase domain-containing protein [Chloroflexota bacterium]MBT4513855.1 methyltransferase domain-containing protein [Chloroflexota bacterium]MBT5318843.1 methyltransferase domain-containing protein [Chloroflexota bacterium]MBT6681389.1 methyltransferase domain-containing protein [Chloroflexota bacterium]